MRVCEKPENGHGNASIFAEKRTNTMWGQSRTLTPNGIRSIRTLLDDGGLAVGVVRHLLFRSSRGNQRPQLQEVGLSVQQQKRKMDGVR